MQAVKAPALAFPQGCQVTVLDEIVVRAEESLDSKVVTVLREGTLLDVLHGGFEPETRRLYVRHDQSGCSGWISCIAMSGHPWVSLVASVSQVASHTEATTALPSMLVDPPAPEDQKDAELSVAERLSDQEVLRELQISAGDSRPAWKELDSLAGAWLANVPQEAWRSAPIMS
ncbi:unnamed protein product [Symbiodinium sp. CCMP2592]|nr:unnamed protein product [Symbiodinium sp. CCMP2592]